jgi:MtN3 and saliva related transmembrane protein
MMGAYFFLLLIFGHYEAESKCIFVHGDNKMELQQIIGLTAGAFTTLSFLPQVIHTVKTKSSRDLSLGMVCFFVIGIIMWLIYGIMARAWPIILSNAVTFVLASVLFVFIIRYRK